MRWMVGRLSPFPSLLFTWLQIEKEREKEKGSIIPPPLAPDQTPLPPNVELPLSFVCLATIDPVTDWKRRSEGEGEGKGSLRSRPGDVPLARRVFIPRRSTKETLKYCVSPLILRTY